MIEYEIIKVAPSIYWLKHQDQYDMSLLHLRSQEFYESPNELFRNKPFTILDYMEWWSKNHDGVFDYPTAWAGFNISSIVLDAMFKTGIPDPNKYDAEMKVVHKQITEMAWKEDYSDSYYLIGSMTETVDPHELGHGRFHCEKDYRKEMTKLVEKLDSKTYEKMCQWLTKIGYTEEVFTDEIQAYLSTSLPADLKTPLNGNLADRKKICQLFRNAYRKHNAELPSLKTYWEENTE